MISMAYIFTIIFISKLVSVEMACLLVIQNEIQAVCTVKAPLVVNAALLGLFYLRSVLTYLLWINMYLTLE